MEQNLTPIIKDSFLQFAGAVLQNRALVDVRDCIKPSARQIFYCMFTDGFVHSKPFQKTLKAIGSAFRLYIHGDSSAEGVIMRAGQNFAMRYPLVEVEGSAGTLLASGSWAAPRYTSARLSPLANYLFEDLKKDTIKEWRDNYDNTEQYPSVLPSKGFFNLVNGTFGLGVGASSSIPQYNLKELNNALITLIQNPDCSFDEIYCAPDFATGATIINADQVKESHRTGTGFACKIRSTVEWDSKERCFVVTEIPYMVYTETICKELEDIINSDNNPGIERFNDLTGKTPLIKIYLNKKANPDKVLRFLFKNTSLQSFYSINFTMLDNGRFPKVFTWKEILQAHIDHEKEVYRRGFEFDLAKVKARMHIIEGLIFCMSHIDEVVSIIKSSSTTVEATKKLMDTFPLDEVQVKAILDMKLSRLAHLEAKKLADEYDDLTVEANRLTSILNNTDLFNNELIAKWREVAQKFGDERRTKILNLSEDSKNEPIEIKQLAISITNNASVYVNETSSLYSQRRNGVGAKFKLDKNEYVIESLIGHNTDTILFFTKKGNFYHKQLSEFTLDEKLYLDFDDAVIAATVLSPENRARDLLFVTKNGLVKKSSLTEYNLKRNGGAQAIKLDTGDEIVTVLPLNNENIGILSQKGNFIMIATSELSSIGRVTRGVIGMKLDEGDSVISARIIPSATKELVSISEDGFIKRSNIDEFRVTGRATKGKKIQKATLMSDFLPIMSTEDILVVASSSQIRLNYSDIPSTLPGAQGVRSIKLPENSKIIKIQTF